MVRIRRINAHAAKTMCRALPTAAHECGAVVGFGSQVGPGSGVHGVAVERAARHAVRSRGTTVRDVEIAFVQYGAVRHLVRWATGDRVELGAAVLADVEVVRGRRDAEVEDARPSLRGTG